MGVTASAIRHVPRLRGEGPSYSVDTRWSTGIDSHNLRQSCRPVCTGPAVREPCWKKSERQSTSKPFKGRSLVSATFIHRFDEPPHLWKVVKVSYARGNGSQKQTEINESFATRDCHTVHGKNRGLSVSLLSIRGRRDKRTPDNSFVCTVTPDVVHPLQDSRRKSTGPVVSFLS